MATGGEAVPSQFRKGVVELAILALLHKGEAYGAEILHALKLKVDTTLGELVEMLLSRHGQRFASSTIWRFLDRHAMTVKKNGARSRAGQARRRRAARRVDRRAA